MIAMIVPASLHAQTAPDPATIVVTGIKDRLNDATAATRESVTIDQLRTTTALFNAEDSLRYLPSLLVRKRHIGDTQAPLATRTSGVGSSARSLIYVDGMLLSALIGNNNSTAAPRWGMVAPEEIERVEILYGPFDAAYAGNSIGGVVNIQTHNAQALEASLVAGASLQTFEQYGTHDSYAAYQASGSIGQRLGRLSIFASANHVASQSQPLAYATVVRPAAPASGGTPVTGAYDDLNRTGVPIYVIGASGLEDHRQDNLKLKLGLDVSPGLSLSYRGGLFLNRTDADAQTYLSGDTYAGTVSIDGQRLSIPAPGFSNNVYSFDERHWMHGLLAKGTADRWTWQATGSLYRYAKDEQRIPGTALPAAGAGGPGSIVRLDGTGWDTIDLSASDGSLSLGAHVDTVRLRQDRFATTDWIEGPIGARTQSARGRTRTAAVWVQRQFLLARPLTLTLGARYEWWRADRGFNFSASPTLAAEQPEQRREGLSPKVRLGWAIEQQWSATFSVAQAFRFPTVQELYQAVSTGPTITVPNPDRRPERARSAELAIEYRSASGHIRLSLFREHIRNALISQSAPLVLGSTTLFNYIQNIPKDRTNGVELAFDRRGLIVPNVDVSGSVTLVDPTIVRDPAFPAAEGKDIPQVPRRRATLVVTWRPMPILALTLAGRSASRSYGTIDNSDVVVHTYQGFEGYNVIDARATVQLDRRTKLAIGIENLGNDKYYLFHPFPQRTFTAELHWTL